MRSGAVAISVLELRSCTVEFGTNSDVLNDVPPVSRHWVCTLPNPTADRCTAIKAAVDAITCNDGGHF